MSICSNIYKLRSSLVRYESFNDLLPKRDGYQSRFSDVDMFHQYRGHRLFIELKHRRAFKKPLPEYLHEMYTVGMNRGEFGLVLYGTYTDINKGQSNYYSEFNPDHAILYSGKNQRIFKYTNIDKQWLSNTFKSWYNWVDKQYKEAA